MKTIHIELKERSYPVYLGRGLLSDGAIWNRHLGQGKTLIVSNEVVAPLYLETLTSALAERVIDVHIIPDGERHKNAETWYGILDKLVSMEARRDSNIVALGGGVVGDISGFCGSLLHARHPLSASSDHAVSAG